MASRKGDIHSDKRTYDPEHLAEVAANVIVEGNGSGFRTAHNLGPVTDQDRKTIARITGETVEQFNSRLSEKLRTIADKAAARIQEKLEADAFKPSELGFILAVAEDKRTRLDGTHSLQASSVNIQVNNYGQVTKSSLLDQLSGAGVERLAAVVEPILPSPSTSKE